MFKKECKDERITQVRNQVSSQSFYIWFGLLFIDLFYKVFYKGVPFEQIGDIFVIFMIGAGYNLVMSAIKGVYSENFKRILIKTVTVGLIVGSIITLFLYVTDQIDSVGQFIFGFVVGLTIILSMVYLLVKRWNKKNNF